LCNCITVGIQGIQGSTGPPGRGEKGEPGTRGVQGKIGYQGIKGEKGSSGLSGSTGLTGPPGSKGQKGAKGVQAERNGGAVYVRWGHNQCPSTAQLVYSGTVGGTVYTDSGSGSNPQCLPPNSSYLTTVSGVQKNIATMYGAEYEVSEYSHLRSKHDHDIPCAVCYVSQRSTVYMVPAKYTCPSGWTREYYGYLMAEHWKHHRSQFTCIDIAMKSIPGSASNHNGLLFYPVEGYCGSLPCPPYKDFRELTCAVCTK